MEILGANDEGILVLRTNRVVLTNTESRACFPAGVISDEDITLMLDQPLAAFYGILAHNNFSNVAILCEFRLIQLNNDGIELNIKGCKRVSILDNIKIGGRVIALEIKELECPNNKPEEVAEMMSDIIAYMETKSPTNAEILRTVKDPSKFADMCLNELINTDAERLKALNTLSILTRMREVHMAIESTTDKLTSKDPDVASLIKKFYTLELPKKAHDEIYTTLKTLSKTNKSASEFPVQFRYAEFAISLPWTETTTDNDIAYVEKELEASHFGMKKAKERLVEYLAVKKLNPKSDGFTILLDGAPGTGKTTLALSLGKAMGRKVERLSLGGCCDPSFFKGHGRTYTGSRYGRIMQAIHSSGVKNPIIVLDEVEKVADGVQGSATATLLEILDPKTNVEFTDAYLGFDFDLSEVIFIATSNERYEISPPVLDRMEYIACDGYTMAEKIKIATKYTIPTVTKDLGIPDSKISKSVLTYIIEGYTREAGVRGLEKALTNCLRKVAVEKSKGKDIKVTKKLVLKRLGQRYEETKPMNHTEPGIVSGMYYSTNGGGVLDIEAIITNFNGEGSLTVTGQCGDVMLESIELVRAHMAAKDYGMDGQNLHDWDIHIHMPEGATPKDGPSAGGAYALLFASLLLDTPVKEGMCLTGECNLHGHIMPIGGVNQKCAGAVRNGFTTVCLPKANKRDWEELPKHVKEGATYHFVSTVEELLDIAFEFEDAPEEVVTLANELVL